MAQVQNEILRCLDFIPTSPIWGEQQEPAVAAEYPFKKEKDTNNLTEIMQFINNDMIQGGIRQMEAIICAIASI